LKVRGFIIEAYFHCCLKSIRIWQNDFLKIRLVLSLLVTAKLLVRKFILEAYLNVIVTQLDFAQVKLKS